ncbi:MAG: 4Fe-4S binding protein [Deltaproteobacteria bacterium]|nr:MAG: 4Fe-4S binding protein [Deltaproteobacteria bacterium]
MKVNRKIIEIDEELCNGCGQCVPSCAEGALEIVDGKAKLVSEVYCDGLGACLAECPTGALTVVESEAEEFDEEAVEEYLSSKAQEEHFEEATMACGCPSTQIQSFAPATPCEEANEPAIQKSQDSALSHWPVQIKLVPPTAPFLKGADLLVAADCTPVAYPNFHQDFLKGKAVMVGCPKFDDGQEYVQKFAAIFSTAGIRSVTVVVMEVPCCQGLPIIVEKGMEMSGKRIPMEKVVISAKGEVLGREKLAA